MKRLAAVTATVMLAGAALAVAGTAATGADAVKKANACLMRHGAKSAGGGVVGNGIASFPGGQSVQYAYNLTKAWPLQNGTATGVKEIHYTRGVTAAQRLTVRRCVYGALK